MALKPPPHDASGETLPHDHPGILPEDGIIRRISELQLVFDPKVECRRISSKAFNPSSSGGLSVDLETQILEAGLEPRVYVTTPRWVGSIRFQAGHMREVGFKVGYDPLIDNPHHGEVWGNFNRTNRRALRQICDWLVPIPDAVIGDE